MEIRRLKHLIALADTRNFSRAASQCHLSQPAFSRSIQAAETELGMALFERGGPEVRCTPAGTFVLERARKLVMKSRGLERDISLYRERLMGDLSLGTGPYPAATLVPALLTQMRLRYAGVNVRVEVNKAIYLERHLRSEELDFYVADLRNLSANSDLKVTRICQLSAALYVRSGHPLLSAASVSGPDVMPYGLASVDVPKNLRLLLAPLMGWPEGTAMPIALETDDLNLLKTVVIGCNTVLACAKFAVQQEVATGQLVPLNVTNLPPLFADVGIVSLKDRSFSPVAQYAVEFLTQLGASLD